MNWFILIIAGLFEVGFTSSLGKAKESQGAEMYFWYGSFFICMLISMLLLMKAVQRLPMGTAYAVWTGIGAAGTVLMGIFFFKEPVDIWRIVFITTLILSIVGLKLVSNH